MTDPWITGLGYLAACLTTLCWLPQTYHIIKTQDAAAISLSSKLVLAFGLSLWLAYGILISSWPLIVANIMTLSQVGLIIFLKIRHNRAVRND